jgi:hypothetical protein
MLAMDGESLIGIVSNRDVRTPVGMAPRVAAVSGRTCFSNLSLIV